MDLPSVFGISLPYCGLVQPIVNWFSDMTHGSEKCEMAYLIFYLQTINCEVQRSSIPFISLP